MNATPPLFSIVVPTYNRAHLMDRVVSSVQRQTFTDWELLIVDDGSTDRTQEVVLRLASTDSRVRHIRLDVNSGLPAIARNRGIAEARGEYIAFLDSDDYWWPKHLEIHARSHHELAAPGLCYSHLWTRRRGWPLFGLLFVPSPRQQAESRQDLLKRNSIQCSAVTVSRALLVSHQGFNESPRLAAVEDYELWLRLADSGPIAYIPRLTGTYSSAQGISTQLDMEKQLAWLSEEIGAPIGRRSRTSVLVERFWGVPAALATLAVDPVRRRYQRT